MRFKIGTLGLLLAGLALAPPAPAGSKLTPCKITARWMAQACRQDVREERLIALANCINLSDYGEATECAVEALEEAAEAQELCGVQRAGRLDLCNLLGEERYDPDLDPANFVTPEEAAASPNPYFPLVPGHTWVYENNEDDETITVTVLDETIEIAGVSCAVVRDIVVQEGEVIEDTLDWYAQDLDGTVWYFGEISRNFEDGRLTDLDGSWITGEDHAKAGIIMAASPYAGMAYRQELLLDDAEDAGEVIAVGVSESVPAVSCDDCLQTRDFTPLEPDANEYKFYAPGIGPILEIDIESGERVELVSFTPGS